MIMARMKPKNIIKKCSIESLEKQNNYGRRKVEIMCILRTYKKNTGDLKLMTSGSPTDRRETQS
jgi:hypothetical protein